MHLSFFSILCLASVTVTSACSESHMRSRESDAPEFEGPSNALADGGRDGDDSEDDMPIDSGVPDGGDVSSQCPDDVSVRAGASCAGDVYCRYVVETCACDTLYEYYYCRDGVLEYSGRDYDCRPCAVPSDYECPAEPPEGFPGPSAPEGALCIYEDLLCECTGETYNARFERRRSQWLASYDGASESPCQCPEAP